MRDFVLAAAIAATIPLPARAADAAMELQGRGVQVYVCQQTATGYG